MKPGQVLRKWWQDYVSGGLRTPQDLYRAALAENFPTSGDHRFFGDFPSDDEWRAPARLQYPVYWSLQMYLDQSNRADWQSTDLRLQRWAALFIEYARKRQIPLYVHCATRTEAEQALVYARGNSRAQYPSSAHNIGEAVDIVHGRYHWDMTRQEWQLLYTLGMLALDRINATLPKAQKLELKWGGHFRTLYDPAHWEIADYRGRLRRLPLADPVRLTPRGILSKVRL